MTDQEKTVAQKLAEVITKLPEQDKRYIQGYAEGVCSAAAGKEDKHD